MRVCAGKEELKEEKKLYLTVILRICTDLSTA